MDLRTGEAELIRSTRFDYSLSPDGATLYVLEPVDGDAAGHTKIIAHDLGTGQNRELAEIEGAPQVYPMSVSVSPEGRRLVLISLDGNSRIMVVSTSDGEAREIFTPGPLELNQINQIVLWTPDGQAVLWYRSEQSESGGLWRIPVDGGAPALLIPWQRLQTDSRNTDVGSPSIVILALSADGQLAYESGRRRGEYWMISGFQARDQVNGDRRD